MSAVKLVDARLNSFTPDREVTAHNRAWAAAHLADLPTVYTFHPGDPVKEAVAPSGETFRRAFTIVASPANTRRFNVHLLAGASSEDLSRAHRLIRNARLGHFNADLWQHREDRGIWVHSKWWERSEGDHRDELRECAVPGCITQWHSWIDGEQGDLCELEPIRGEWHSVFGFRAQGREWEASASVCADPPEGPEGLRAIRDLANDYAWMMVECERLNAARSEETGKPSL